MKTKPFDLLEEQRIPFDSKKHIVTSDATALKDEYLANAGNNGYFQSLLLNEKNRLDFFNPSGPLDIGLCWWHSRLQRNATYLCYYDPHKDAPTKREAKKIVKRIISAWDVVEVPGYTCLNEFSSDFYDIFTKELGKWQIIDSFFLFQWIRGLKGKPQQNEEDFTKTLRELYQYVNRDHKIAYVMQQIPGFDAHAFLIPHISKTDDEYTVAIVDSNYPNNTFQLILKEGSNSPVLPIIGHLSLYLQFDSELDKCLSRINTFLEGRKNEEDTAIHPFSDPGLSGILRLF